MARTLQRPPGHAGAPPAPRVSSCFRPRSRRGRQAEATHRYGRSDWSSARAAPWSATRGGRRRRQPGSGGRRPAATNVPRHAGGCGRGPAGRRLRGRRRSGSSVPGSDGTPQRSTKPSRQTLHRVSDCRGNLGAGRPYRHGHLIAPARASWVGSAATPCTLPAACLRAGGRIALHDARPGDHCPARRWPTGQRSRGTVRHMSVRASRAARRRGRGRCPVYDRARQRGGRAASRERGQYHGRRSLSRPGTRPPVLHPVSFVRRSRLVQRVRLVRPSITRHSPVLRHPR